MGNSSCIQPTMTLGRFKEASIKTNQKVFKYNRKIKLSSFLYLMKLSPTCIHIEVTEQKPRLGGSGPTVRILGMIDRLEPKVNLSPFLQKQSYNYEY